MVNAFQGINYQVMLGEEATRGSLATINENVGLIQDVNESGSIDVENHKTLASAVDATITTGLEHYKVDISHKMQDMRCFKYMFGDPTGEATTTGDTVHSWTSISAIPASASIQVGANDGTTQAYRNYLGGVLTSGTIGVTKDGVLEAKTSWMAIDRTEQTSSIGTPTVSTQSPLRGVDALFKVGGSAVAEAQSWEVTFDRKGTELSKLGQANPLDVRLNELTITGKATIGYKGNTQATYIEGGSNLTVNLYADNGVSLGSGQRQIDIALTNTQVSSVGIPAKIGDFVIQDMSFTGRLSSIKFIDNVANY